MLILQVVSSGGLKVTDSIMHKLFDHGNKYFFISKYLFSHPFTHVSQIINEEKEGALAGQ